MALNPEALNLFKETTCIEHFRRSSGTETPNAEKELLFCLKSGSQLSYKREERQPLERAREGSAGLF